MKKYKMISVIFAVLMLFTAFSSCTKENEKTDLKNNDASSEFYSGNPVNPDTELNIEDMFANRDKEIGYTDYVEIRLSNGNISVNSGNVKIDGNTVTVLSGGTYALSGSISNGQIVVDAGKEDKIQLILQGVDINCDSSAAIYIKQADKVFITLDNATTNTFSNKEEFISIDENSIDAVIFSRGDLTLNGNGSIFINAVYGHGIVSKDDLIFTSGNYNITCAGHGLEGKDSVRIADGSFTIISGKDGIHAENVDDAALGFIYISGGNFDITTGTDGLDATAALQIDGGTFNITTGGGSQNASTDERGNQRSGWGRWNQEAASISETASAKGLKADGDLLINSGSFIIDSSDDSLHSNSSIYIKVSIFDLSSGDDGIHADTKVAINGGTITISKSYEGIEGQCIDITSGLISISASDDGLNAAGVNDGSGLGGRLGQGGFNADSDCYIKISGGMLTINASGDGIDSNGNLYVAGGETYVSGPTSSGNGALDYNGTAQITGGIFIAAGSSGMVQNFGTSSTQGAILYNCSNSQSGGSLITLIDKSDNVIVFYTPEKQYNSVVVSAPGINQGSSFTLVMGTDSQSITMQNLIYGSGGMGGAPGGQPEGRR
ncbi:MAG: carbohydrate-binding domain-containing protein [Eubacteriales bacterium]